MRRLFGAHAWAKWRCANCGALLKFKILRRIPISIGLGPLMFGMYLFTKRHINSAIRPEALVVIFALVLTPMAMAMEGVKVIEYGRGFCRDCGYNLTGLASNQCPECGRLIEHEERVPGDEDQH